MEIYQNSSFPKVEEHVKIHLSCQECSPFGPKGERLSWVENEEEEE